MDDVRAVMDAAGSERAVLWSGGTSTGHRRALRGDLPRALRRPRPLRPARSREPARPTTRGRRPRRSGASSCADVRAGWGERGYLERLAREWAPGGRRGRRLPRLVRLAHAPQPQPGRRADVVPDRDGARRQRRPRRGPRADARHAPARRLPGPAHYTAERIRGAEVVELPAFERRLHVGRRRRPRATMAATARFVSRLTERGEPASACSRPSSSPTSSARPSSRRSSATRPGGSCSSATTRSSAASSRGSRAASSTPPATGSSPRSTGRPAPSRLPPRSATPLRAHRPRDPGRPPHRRVRGQRRQDRRASRSRSARASRRSPGPARCSSRARSRISSPAPGSAFEDRGEHQLKGVPDAWHLFALAPG